MTTTEETEVRVCDYTINGPKVGRNVVLWRKQCSRKVRVPIAVPSWSNASRCWQKHRSGR